MLKDHGTMRPTVFEVLGDVHRMRGTQSQFQYTAAMSQPLVSNRPPHTKHATSSALDGVITYKSPKAPHKSTPPSTPAKNQGQLARDKVMEAIAPMRRGRPSPSKDLSGPNSRQPSPQKAVTGDKLKLNLNGINLADDEKAWKLWVAEATQSAKPSSLLDDSAWGLTSGKENVQRSAPSGFNDNFAENLRPSMESSTISHVGSKQTPRPVSLSPSQPRESGTPTRHAPPPQSPISIISRRNPAPRTERDAFDGLGLGLPTEKREPTLGEARKFRTGLAIPSSARPRLEPENRLSGSPHTSYLTPQPYLQTQAFLSTSPSNGSSASSTAQVTSRPPSSMHIDGMPLESRFPSLEELDASFLNSVKSQSSTHPPISAKSINVGKQIAQSETSHEKSLSDTPTKRTEKMTQEKQGSGHTRIFQFADNSEESLHLDKGKALPSTMVDDTAPRRVSSLSLKPTITRRQRTSISFKPKTSAEDNAVSIPSQLLPSLRDEAQRPPHTPPSKLASQPRDWLTGDENLFSPSTPPRTPNSDIPILRRSPSKRASVIEKSEIFIPEAVVAQPEHASTLDEYASDKEVSPTIIKFSRQFPPVGNGMKGVLSDAWDTSTGKDDADSSSSTDEGPEDANGLPAAVKSGSLPKHSRRRGRQSSVHDLVDMWGGGAAPHSKHEGHTNEVEERVVPRSQQTTRPLSPLWTPLSLVPTSNPSEHSFSNLEPTGISSDRKQNLSLGGISSSSRPRPQSLLLPLRPAEASSHKSTLLEAPSEAKRRQSVRRTSISDMVEKYEAMGGHVKHAGMGARSPSPHIIKKSPSSKSTSQVMDRDRSLNSIDTGTSLAVPPSPTPSARQRTSPTRLTRSPDMSRLPETPEGRKSNAIDSIAPRARKLSLKPHENPKPPVSLHELLAADERKEKSNADHSPTAERSYQGVGKLIDQWQRKAEEAEPRAPGGKRSSVIMKRPTSGTSAKG